MKIFHNANIYAPDHPNATALVIDNSQFIALGTEEEIFGQFSDQAKYQPTRKNHLAWPDRCSCSFTAVG